MNDIIVAHLENNDYRNTDNKNFLFLTNKTSQSLSESSKQPTTIPIKTWTIKSNRTNT